MIVVDIAFITPIILQLRFSSTCLDAIGPLNFSSPLLPLSLLAPWLLTIGLVENHRLVNSTKFNSHSIPFHSSQQWNVIIHSIPFFQTTIPFLPVFSSMKLLTRYSLGSIAIGSLIVSFIESTRFILEAIRRRLKVADIMPENFIKRMMFHTSRFCLKGIELTIKSVNRNAYIMVKKIEKLPFFLV